MIAWPGSTLNPTTEERTYEVIKRLLSMLLLLAAAAFISGCVPSKTITGQQGCNTRVAAQKRGPCHACLRKGPRHVYKPHRGVGYRCVRR